MEVHNEKSPFFSGRPPDYDDSSQIIIVFSVLVWLVWIRHENPLVMGGHAAEPYILFSHTDATARPHVEPGLPLEPDPHEAAGQWERHCEWPRRRTAQGLGLTPPPREGRECGGRSAASAQGLREQVPPQRQPRQLPDVNVCQAPGLCLPPQSLRPGTPRGGGVSLINISPSGTCKATRTVSSSVL
jgi:hypothetical protein